MATRTAIHCQARRQESIEVPLFQATYKVQRDTRRCVHRWPRLGSWLVLCGILSACSAEDQGAPGGFQRPATSVTVAVVETRAMSDVIEALGTTRANESLTLTAKLTDTVSRVDFDDGDIVDAGAVLVELTNTEQTALLAEAQANLDDARRQLRRLKELYEQRSVPISNVDEAEARVNAAQGRYDSVVARLDDRLIRAPFAGLLGFRQVSAGTLVTPGTAIATLDDISLIKLDFAVPEIHLALLRPGLALTARSSAYPDHLFEATVQTVDSRVDPVTRAALVRAHIDNQDALLRPGMLLTVRLKTRERHALSVPETALLQRSGGVYVYVVETDATASLKPVQLGARYQGFAEITGGLNEGEQVISEGVLKVRDNAKVLIIDEVSDSALAEQSALDSGPKPVAGQ